MKIIYSTCLVAFLLTEATDLSFAFSKTVTGGNSATVTIPTGVSTVRFYAIGGAGGAGSPTNESGAGGGGAFASSMNGYIIYVGGGGGAGGGRDGGAGGSTAGSGVGLGGGPGGGVTTGYDGIKNGAGGGGANCCGYVVSGAGGRGGVGGQGGASDGEGGIGSGGGAGGAGYGGSSYYVAGGKAYAGGGSVGIRSGGGGGGYGGGGGGGAVFPMYMSGGGGSSYFNRYLSAPDTNGYVSIPVSKSGNSIFLASGKGGLIYPGLDANPGNDGTITIAWDDPPSNCSSLLTTISTLVSGNTCSYSCPSTSNVAIGGKATCSVSSPINYTGSLERVCDSTGTWIIDTTTNKTCIPPAPTVNIWFSSLKKVQTLFDGISAILKSSLAPKHASAFIFEK